MRPTPPPTPRPSVTPVTYTLCALLAALAVARKLTEQRSGDMLSRFGALTLPIDGGGDLWRLASYGLVHAGTVHLAVNLAALALFGGLTERLLGGRRYLAVYFTASCVGAASVALAARGPVLLVGASASIFGLVGASLAWTLSRRGPRRAADLYPFAAVAVVQLAADAFSHAASGAAHAGGMAAGALLGLAFRADVGDCEAPGKGGTSIGSPKEEVRPWDWARRERRFLSRAPRASSARTS